ncbi:uncharacterized protein LOC130697463 [Daphnia carinata]|uniref:uncharacterized protein LOC130688135 n=1 Tax=Daphnia carinata TaxID=120202 RepID=UPI00257C3733|nr:uncharacterized protein LOC130688135 [Daphnia carinata]XP_057376350.1 uncharacterized protein LOC130697463 [Daphnia carinata]
MRLSSILCGFRKKLPPGNIWTGKHRMVYKHNEENAERLRKRFAIEEQNMFYLRHSFLTHEEEKGFSRELGKHEKWLTEKVKEKQARPYRPHVTLEEHLGGALIVTNKWD